MIVVLGFSFDLSDIKRMRVSNKYHNINNSLLI